MIIRKLCSWHKTLSDPSWPSLEPGGHIQVEIEECEYCIWDKSEDGQKLRSNIKELLFGKKEIKDDKA